MPPIPPMPATRRPEWDVLLSAAQKNNVERIHALVQQHGVPPSHANGVGQSGLHVAALWGHVEACQALLELGADQNAPNSLTGATPLHMVVQPPHKASFAQQELVVDLLLRHGADKNRLDSFGKLPVDYVLEQLEQTPPGAFGRPPASLIEKLQLSAPSVWTLIQQGNWTAVQTELTGMDQETAVQTCAQVYRDQNAFSIASTSVLQECQQNLQSLDDDKAEDEDGSATAVVQDRWKILQSLVQDHGARPMSVTNKKKDDLEDPPLFQALELLQEAYQEQQKDADVPPPLFKTTIVVLEDTVRLLWKLQQQEETSLAAASNSSKESLDQARWLHNAARRNTVSMIRFLGHELQWDMNVVNRQGMTALQFAARSGRVEALECLLTEFASTMNVHHTDQQGKTALDAARSNNRTAIIAILEPYYYETNEATTNQP